MALGQPLLGEGQEAVVVGDGVQGEAWERRRGLGDRCADCELGKAHKTKKNSNSVWNPYKRGGFGGQRKLEMEKLEVGKSEVEKFGGPKTVREYLAGLWAKKTV